MRTTKKTLSRPVQVTAPLNVPPTRQAETTSSTLEKVYSFYYFPHNDGANFTVSEKLTQTIYSSTSLREIPSSILKNIFEKNILLKDDLQEYSYVKTLIDVGQYNNGLWMGLSFGQQINKEINLHTALGIQSNLMELLYYHIKENKAVGEIGFVTIFFTTVCSCETPLEMLHYILEAKNDIVTALINFDDGGVSYLHHLVYYDKLKNFFEDCNTYLINSLIN
jgi:hypothetical protein